MKSPVNSVMRGNVSIRAALGLFKIIRATVQEHAEAACLRQKFQNDKI
jgi:hypothetical protein